MADIYIYKDGGKRKLLFSVIIFRIWFCQINVCFFYLVCSISRLASYSYFDCCNFAAVFIILTVQFSVDLYLFFDAWERVLRVARAQCNQIILYSGRFVSILFVYRCMYVYIYIYIYIYIHVYMYVCMYVCMCVCIYIPLLLSFALFCAHWLVCVRFEVCDFCWFLLWLCLLLISSLAGCFALSCLVDDGRRGSPVGPISCLWGCILPVSYVWFVA